ncbi:MAG: hypothetical protein Fues2KO_47000 [Fuerstiella sp.]
MNATDAKRLDNTLKKAAAKADKPSRFSGLFRCGVVKPIRSLRNRPCPCGSGRKFKLCCDGKPIPTQQRPRPQVESE